MSVQRGNQSDDGLTDRSGATGDGWTRQRAQTQLAQTFVQGVESRKASAAIALYLMMLGTPVVDARIQILEVVEIEIRGENFVLRLPIRPRLNFIDYAYSVSSVRVRISQGRRVVGEDLSGLRGAEGKRRRLRVCSST